MIPFHEVIQKKTEHSEFLFEFEVPAKDGAVAAQAYHVDLNGLPTYLIAGEPIRKDAIVYSSNPEVDDFKFIFFSLTALELAKKLD